MGRALIQHTHTLSDLVEMAFLFESLQLWIGPQQRTFGTTRACYFASRMPCHPNKC